MHGIGQKSAEVTQRRAQAMLARQQVASARGDDVQPVTRVLQHLLHAAAVKVFQILAKLFADARGAGALLARQHLKMLTTVVVFQALKGADGVAQAGGRHAPRANRGAHQMHRLGGSGEPIAKNEPVQRPQHQAFRTTRCAGHHLHVLRLKAVGLNMLARFGPSVDAQGVHGNYRSGVKPKPTG